MRSFKKKVKSLFEHGLDPVTEGVHNFKNPAAYTEALAVERSITCSGCPFFKTEPIDMFRVTDKLIPTLSDMYCEECGCTSSYKLRQSIIKCDKWQK